MTVVSARTQRVADALAAGYALTLDEGTITHVSPDTRTVTVKPQITGATSDGYHTFDDLYDHRMALTAALTRCYGGISYRSKLHHPSDEPMFNGFFIVGMSLPTGQVTYHYKLEYWHVFDHVQDAEYAPKWDGHSPADVVKRLEEWAARP